MTFASEPISVVEIVEPRCSRTFGVSPCLATGTACYNTDASCRFITALDLTDEVSTFFVMPAANRSLPSGFQPGTAIPALIDVDTAPTVLNVGAGNEDISPLGLRSVATVGLRDFPSNDVGFDPYLSTRSFDPVTRGSFWTKWLVRHPYHVGYTLRVYDGYFGDELADMIKREYSIEKIDASRASVRITAKDILRKVTDTEVTAPVLSPGALSLDLADTGTSFQVSGAVVADYPATGHVRIGDELIAYTGRALVGTNVEFTGLTRGALNTAPNDHSQFDQVQRVLSYVDQPVSDIIYDLLVTWGSIPTTYITKADWDAEWLEWRELYRFTGHVTSPVQVQKLVGELCQQGLMNVWWDERIQKILLRAQRPNFSPGIITQEGHIVADSVVITEKPESRASQVYVYYGLRNPVMSLTDKASFANAEVFIDVDKERQYGGETKVKEIFCRWVNTGVIARSLGGAYLLRFRDVRRHITFNLTAKDISTFWTGDIAEIRHFLSVDMTGLEAIQPWLITSAETVEQGGLYRFVAEDAASAGVLWQWVADDETGDVMDIGCWVDADGTDGAGNTPPFAWV